MINDGERVPVCLESTEFFRMKGEGMETEFILLYIKIQATQHT